MGVPAADPAAAVLDAAFAEAMGAAPKPKEPAPPPETDPDAPHGRDEAGIPLEPYGRNKDGSIRKSAAGRKARDPDSKARISSDPAPGEARTGTVISPQDFTEGLDAFGDAVWLSLTMAGKLPLGRLPFVPASAPVLVRAEATLFRGHKPMLVSAVNLAAQHSARARRLAEKLDTGDMTWALTSGMMCAPFIIQSVALWKGAVTGDVIQDLAGQNDTDLQDFIDQLKQMMTEAAEQAAGQLAQPGAA